MNILDSDRAKDKFAKIDFDKLLRTYCFNAADIKLTPKHFNLFESGPLQLFLINRPEITFG